MKKRKKTRAQIIFHLGFLILLASFTACKETGINPEPLHCTITVSHSSLEMEIGESQIITATVSNCSSLSWESGNNDVVKLEQTIGNEIEITGVSEGSALIRASATAENNQVTEVIVNVEIIYNPVVVYKKSSLNDFEDDVWIADIRGNERKITNYADNWDGISFSQQWHENGERVAYLRRGDEEIYSINLRGESKTALTDNEVSFIYTFKISNSGERIAFVGRETSEDGSQLSPISIFVKNMDTNETTPIKEVEGGGFDILIDWSPDDEKLVFSDVVDNEFLNIFVINSDGSGEAQNITNSDSFDFLPVWSPFEEDRIIFYSNRSGDYATYTMNPNGENIQIVIGSEFGCSDWISEDELVCMGGDRQGNGQIDLYKVSLDGSSEILFDWPDTNEFYPNWRIR